MNQIFVLKNLLRLVGMAWLAIPLAAQIPLASAELCGPETAGKIAKVGLPGPRNPLASIHAHLCGFHFYSGDLSRALRVEHYCSHLNSDVTQCVIYDSDRPNARLIGVEYVISETLFNTLSADEKPLWHSHRYEVVSGLLTAPGLSAAAEGALMKAFANTYGKTWHLWQVDRGDALPLGLPKLMMGFTAEGQVAPAIVAARDREQLIDVAAVKARRAGYGPRPVATGADAWQHGPAFQINDDLLKNQSASQP